MQKTLFALLAVFVPATASAQARQIQPNTQYAGGSQVAFSQVGVTLRIPRGFTGVLAPNGAAFVMVSNDQRALVLATAEPGSSFADVKQSMSEPIPLQGAVLTPSGAPKARGRVLRQSYTAGDKIGVAAATVRRGMGVGFIALGEKSDRTRLDGAVASLMQGLKVSKPKTPKSDGGRWAQKLTGYALEYLKTGNGLSTRHTIHLCPNGSFSESGGDSYLSGGFSAVGSHGGGGRWAIRGATLTLTYPNGQTKTYQLTSPDGSKTFLNGYRYFVANPARCG